MDRRNYSVFVSGSAGCLMRFAFRHLKARRAPYRQLPGDAILANVLAAVRPERRANPGIAAR